MKVFDTNSVNRDEPSRSQRWRDASQRRTWQNAVMVPVLGIILAGTLLAMLIWRRHLGSLMQVASLVAALLLMIWLQDNGYLNTKGKPPANADRPAPMSSPR